MSNAKDIRGQIKSVKSTQKITKAMEMVAASKMRRAQENMQYGRPYAQNILRVMSHLLAATSNFHHPYIERRNKINNVAYVLIGTDRGLCGGLNINLFKKLSEHCRQHIDQGHKINFVAFGRKALGFLYRIKGNIISYKENYGDSPQLHELITTIQPLLDDYLAGKIDRVYLVGNRFVNTMTQEPNVFQLLPATIHIQDPDLPSHSWEYIYDPSAKTILEQMMIRYIESLIKQVVAENIACEMSARMIAMKSASDNAGNLIDELQLQYNKARQAAITQELTEIVSGAAAV